MRRLADGLRGRIWAPTAVLIAVGAFVGRTLSVSRPSLVVAAVAWAGLALACGRRGRTVVGPIAASVVALLCAVFHADRVRPSAVERANPVRHRSPVAEVQVLEVVTSPMPTADGWRFEGRWIASCSASSGAGLGCQSRRGRIRVRLRGQRLRPQRFETVRLVGTVWPWPVYDNRVLEFGAAATGGRWAGTMFAEGRAGVRSAGRPGSPLSAAVAVVGRWRARLAGRIRGALPGPEGGLVRAFGLGDRGGIGTGLRSALRATGTSHLLAVSGAHVSLVAAMVWFLLRWIVSSLAPTVWRRVPVWRLLALPCGVAVWGYALLCGGRPSTVRAAMMVSLVLALRAWALARDPVEVIGLAAVILFVLEPASFGDTGLQLSFLGVWGVMLGAGLARRLPAARWGPWRWGRSAVLISLCAQAATSWVAIPTFGLVAWLAPLCNPIAIAYVAFIALPYAIFVVVCASVAGDGWMVGEGAWIDSIGALAAWVYRPVSALEAVSVELWPVTTVGGYEAWAMATGAVAMVLLIATMRRHRLWACGALIVGLLVICVWVREAQRPAYGSVAVHFLDVGHGDAVVLRFGDGRTMLVDGGGRPGGDGIVGRLAVVPALRALGIDRVDVMVLTHAHADHGNGLLAVARALPVGEFWWNGQAGDSEEHRRLMETLARQGAWWRRWPGSTARDGVTEVAMAGATVRALWPTSDVGDAGIETLNDHSLVLEVEVAGHRLLLTGDIERATERALVAGGDLRPLSGVLKVPHHGSRTSSSEVFLRATRPTLAVVSAGLRGGRSLPHPEVSRRYRVLGIALWRTQDGVVGGHFGAGRQVVVADEHVDASFAGCVHCGVVAHANVGGDDELDTCCCGLGRGPDAESVALVEAVGDVVVDLRVGRHQPHGGLQDQR